MSESKVVAPKSGGFWGWILAAFTFLADMWGKLPQETRDKILATLIEGFDGLLRSFFRRFRALEAKAGQEVAR